MQTITITAPSKQLATMLRALENAGEVARELEDCKHENEQLIEETRRLMQELNIAKHTIHLWKQECEELQKREASEPIGVSMAALTDLLEEYGLPESVRTSLAVDIALSIARDV